MAKKVITVLENASKPGLLYTVSRGNYASCSLRLAGDVVESENSMDQQNGRTRVSLSGGTQRAADGLGACSRAQPVPVRHARLLQLR